MAVMQNTFDGGVNGATITPENSGGASGTPFNFIQVMPGATATYASGAALHGPLGARVTGSGAHAFLQQDFAANAKITSRFYVRFPSAPTANCQIYTPRHSGNYIGGLNITTLLKFQVTKLGGGVIFTSATLQAANWYRVEIAHEVGTSATTGKVWFKYFLGDSTTAIETFSTLATDLGVDPIVACRIGKLNSSGSTPIDFDSLTLNTGSVAYLGPHVELNIPPIANAGTSGTNLEPGSTVTLSGSASSDPDGTISSYSWAQTSGPTVVMTGTGATRTVTMPYTTGGAVLGFTLTVTDNAGATSTATVSHTVLSATERIAVNGAWVAAGLYLVSGTPVASDPDPSPGGALYPSTTLYPDDDVFPA